MKKFFNMVFAAIVRILRSWGLIKSPVKAIRPFTGETFRAPVRRLSKAVTPASKLQAFQNKAAAALRSWKPKSTRRLSAWQETGRSGFAARTIRRTGSRAVFA